MMNAPHATGPRAENPYCMKCSQHLTRPLHESSEHPEAAASQSLRDEFDAIVGNGE